MLMPIRSTHRLPAVLMAAVLAGLVQLPAVAQQPAADRTVTPAPGDAAQAANSPGADQDRASNRIAVSSPAGPVELDKQAREARGDGDERSSREEATDSRRVRGPNPILPSEFELFVERSLGRKLNRFGNDLLIPEARDFSVPANATVPPDYILGPGDGIDISLTGSIEGSFSLTIDNDGKLFLPRIGAVKLAGVRYDALRGRIMAAVGQQFRNFAVSVTVKQLRGVRVYVTGFAASPGAYTVSSLSTMVNAVLAAGGPASGGSFRKASLVRGGRVVAELDLYDLLLRGDRSRDVVLQNEDVITIAPLGEQVALIGSVNAEAVYEIKPGENLESLLRLAGGPGVLADTGRLILFRTRDSEALIGREISRSEAPGVMAMGGDIVTVLSAGSLQQPQTRQAVLVRLEGEVARPGNYLVKPGTTLDSVLEQAGGLTATAFPYGTRLERLSVKLQQRAGFKEAVEQFELALAATPLTSAGLNTEDQTRALASAKAVIERLRSAEPDGRLVLDVKSDATSLPGRIVLENSDRIVVPPKPSAVGVFGAVFRPASFLIEPGQRLLVRDYLRRAGGGLRSADMGRMFVVRANGDVLTRQTGALDAPALPGDVIFMPVKTQNNNLLAKIRDISTIIFQLGITTAALVALSR
jgi:protein involved in polysaccharide export with SLBB domain